MKRYLPIVVPAVFCMLVVGVYLTARSAQSAESKLDEAVSADLATAQRLLDGYDPMLDASAAVHERLTGPAGAMSIAEGEPADWADRWQRGQQENAPLPPLPSGLQREVSEYVRKYRELGGTRQEPRAAGGVDAAQAELERAVKDNADRLREAIRAIESAMGKSVSAGGGQTVSGRQHLELNRIRAILAYHQAESLRLSALARRSEIERLHEELIRLRGRWIEVTTALAIAEQALSGPMPERRPAAPESEPAPVGEAPAAKPAEQPAPAAKPPAGGSRSPLMHKLFGALRGAAASAREIEAPSGPAPGPAPEGAPPGPEGKPAAAPKPRGSQPVVPDVSDAAVVPVPAQIRQYESQIAAAQERKRALDAQASELRRKIAALQARIAALEQTAIEADRRMIEIEQAELPADRAALKEQLATYVEASETTRTAVREAQRLRYGGQADDTPGESEPSLAEYTQQLKMVEAGLEGETSRIEILQAAIGSLQKVQEDLQARIAGRTSPVTGEAMPGLRAQQDKLAEQIDAVRTRIEAAATAAAKDEDAAIEELDRGIRAATTARRAAQERQSDARSAQPAGGQPNPRLEMIQNERWMVGGIDAVIADIELLQGWIRYQQAASAERVASILEMVRAMGLTTELDPAERRQKAAELRPAAQEDAEAATESYDAAMQGLDNDWTVHMNAAAAYVLRAKLSEGQAAEDFRRRAIGEYQLGVAGQEDDPLRRRFVPRLESLVKQSAAGAEAAP